MNVTATTAAGRAINALLGLLEDAGMEATRDAGAFFPQPAGILVGLPTLAGRGLGSRSFDIPVLVVSADPLTSVVAVDRIYALADDAALALATDSYRPSNWQPSREAEPLPALELTVRVTVTEE